MMLKVLVVLAALFVSSIEATFGQRNIPCPCGWKKIGNGCYLFVKTKVTWDVARANCLSQGGDLVIPKNYLQDIWLSNHAEILGMRIPWIGVLRRRQDAKFYDTCGKALSYTRWAPDEPNDVGGKENCGHLYAVGTNKSKWNDNECNEAYGYICEIKSPRCD